MVIIILFLLHIVTFGNILHKCYVYTGKNGLDSKFRSKCLLNIKFFVIEMQLSNYLITGTHSPIVTFICRRYVLVSYTCNSTAVAL